MDYKLPIFITEFGSKLHYIWCEQWSVYVGTFCLIDYLLIWLTDSINVFIQDQTNETEDLETVIILNILVKIKKIFHQNH